MQLQSLLMTVLLCGQVLAHPVLDANSAAKATLDVLSPIAKRNQHKTLAQAYKHVPRSTTCTASNMSVRKEWYAESNLPL